jgi:hypothetical protein
LDEETPVNIMIEGTWEILGKPTVLPSLGRIGYVEELLMYLLLFMEQGHKRNLKL